MKLVIVESPNKCQTISGYLGEGYKVMASKGNVRDLATCGKDGLGIDVENDFKATYKIDKDKMAIIKQLTKAAKEADEVLLATDPDREGEAISWHLSQILKLDPQSTKRLLFHEITGPAIQAALADPKTINMALVDSQETRRIYDRVIGFKLSKLLQNKCKCKSAGRVQSATLKMLVDNDNERKAFVPEEYWTLTLTLLIDGQEVEAKLIKVNGEEPSIKNEEQIKQILSNIPDELTLSSVKVEKKKVSPKDPFITSTLAQEAFNKFHFSTKTTASTAQKLFEGVNRDGQHLGLITYIRTDLAQISPIFIEGQAKSYITSKYGEAYFDGQQTKKSKKLVQGAHEAIRPTDLSITPADAESFLNPYEAKLYKLIYERTVASLMKPKQIEVTTGYFEVNGLTFSVSGSKTIFDGFEKALSSESEETKELSNLKEGETYQVKGQKPEQKFTQPPAQINEAKLVKMMESEGIGRPSTYASTIATLLARDYVTSSKGVLTPTETGHRSIEFLEKFFSEIVSSDYTAGMESKLDQIQDQKETKLNALKEFFFPFTERFDTVFKESPKWTAVAQNDNNSGENIGICPKCGAPLVTRKSRYGSFVACSNFPKCDYIEKKEKPKAKETGELCPVCGKPLVERTSKGKTFVACSGFPKCHYIKGNDEAKKAPTYTEADYIKPCPKCGSGFIVKKFSKRGEFFACTNYPKCTYHEYPTKKK